MDALHLLGVAVFQAGRGDEAAGFIERSLHQNPGNADALNILGHVYEFLNLPFLAPFSESCHSKFPVTVTQV